MAQKLDIQTMFFKPEQFWASKGGMIMPSYDENKGAGTMSPDTFLRAVGPEPWKACYVEPSRRPADGRY
ncbi:MAG: glycine--tRNA ligase subunit alpha, partial [Lactobacillus porci]|nr:glycine--tRNA ligase subunit alpha [Lactobacillus porci]